MSEILFIISLIIITTVSSYLGVQLYRLKCLLNDAMPVDLPGTIVDSSIESKIPADIKCNLTLVTGFAKAPDEMPYKTNATGIVEKKQVEAGVS